MTDNHHNANNHNANNHNANNLNVRPDAAGEEQIDARLRQLLAARAVTASESRCTAFKRRVFAKVRRRQVRRQVAARAAFAASLFVLLSASWLLRSGGHIRNGVQNPRRSLIATQEQRPADSNNAAAGLAAFASVYQNDFSPVVKLETLENEPRALLRYLDALAATREQE